MKNTFSTFDVVKLLGINRNTLQSAMDGGFIVPDVKKATKKGEKNLFSLSGLYSIELFFQLLRCGLNRTTASEESSLDWENIGDGPRQNKFLIVEKNSTETMLEGSSRFDASLPMDMEGIIFRMVINLLEIENRVNELLNSIS